MCSFFLFFFFNDTATTEIYTLSLHDALPICSWPSAWRRAPPTWSTTSPTGRPTAPIPSSAAAQRSEEHTSELQSRQYLVCRLLLEKKKNNQQSCESLITQLHNITISSNPYLI